MRPLSGLPEPSRVDLSCIYRSDNHSPILAGFLEQVRAFRANLVLPEAGNSAQARTQWTEDKTIDAWLIWNIWQVSNPDLAQLVEMDEPFRIYRDVGVVITHRGGAAPQAKAFVD